MGKCLFMRKGETHTAPNHGLPSGYTPLAYIESSGTQYINTGFKPNQNTKVVCDFEYTALGDLVTVFGAANSSANAQSYLIIYSASVLYYYYGTTSGNVNIGFTGTGRHLIDCNKNVVTLDGTVHTGTAKTFTTNYPIYLFAYDAAGSVMYPSSSRIYACQIYDGDTLVRDFIPCINASGEVGLYDLVGKQFYGNAGTGVFTGSEVA